MTHHPMLQFAVLAAAVLGILWVLRARMRAGSLVPLLVPVAEIGLLVVLLGSLAGVLTGGRIAPGLALVALAVVVLLAGHPLLVDYVTGIGLRIEGRLVKGDRVAFDGHEGTVRSLGRRVVVLETAEGTLLVPYSRVARAVVGSRRAMEGLVPHRFDVGWDDARTHHEVAEAIRQAALLHPSGVAGRPPAVEATGPTAAQVTVYATSRAGAYEIERSVQELMTASAAPRAGGAS